MSTATALVPRGLVSRVEHGGTLLRRRAALAVVPDRRVVLGRAPFVAGVVTLLVAGLLGLLILNTALGKDAFRLHTLTVDGRALQDQEQTLEQQVQDLSAPQTLAAKAAAMGMVQAGPPAFLRLSDGVVLGSPTAAVGPAADGTGGPLVPGLDSSTAADAGATSGTAKTDAGTTTEPTR